MKRLFNRKYELIVGTKNLSDLDFEFEVKKTLKPEPNTGEIKIYNLSEKTRGEIFAAKKVPVSLSAGYEGFLNQVFIGELRTVISQRIGPDILTELSTGDKEDAVKARLHLTLGAKTAPATALDAIVRALGVKEGNLAEVKAKLALTGKTFLGHGGALSGYATRMLDDFCRSADLEWSIQNGAIQILDRDKPLARQAILLSSATGLVGTPSVDSSGKGLGIVSCRSLIVPDLHPGRLVILKSESVNGGYKIQEVEYKGSTFGDDWYADLKLKKY